MWTYPSPSLTISYSRLSSTFIIFSVPTISVIGFLQNLQSILQIISHEAAELEEAGFFTANLCDDMKAKLLHALDKALRKINGGFGIPS